MKNLILEYLTRIYVSSEVTSGEFIHTVEFPSELGGDAFTKEELVSGIQSFLDWDESDETFDIIKFGKYWYTTRHHATYEDYLTYNGINYPTKILNVTIDEHDDDWVHNYLVAPESLYDLIEDSDDDGLDNQVYHYIEDQYWSLPNEVLAKEHLDLPMTLIEIDED